MILRTRFWTRALMLTSVLIPNVLADIGFSSPAAGATISGDTIDVEFTDGSGSPSLSSFTTYTLQLCAGGNTDKDYTILFTFTDKGSLSTTSYSAQLTNLALGGNTKNAYFLRTIGVAPGGVVYNFSPRFTLSDMTGVFPATVQSALSSISGTAGPDTINQISNAASAAPAAGTGDFAVPYSMQTGIIRYAPMAVVAPNKITAKGNARQYPTSAFTIWSQRTGNPQPYPTQTFTNAFTFNTQSVEPTISPAGQPDDMQKFLNRWKD